jgi:pyruvate formate lyase activating enzyme
MTALKIGGLQPVTASDFPGCMAAIVFTQGCNYHCPFCHNHGLLAREGKSELATKEVLAFLAKRRKVLGGVVISGGEPCLQTGLADFCRQLKTMGFAVKLDTNGSRPRVLEKLLAQGLLDFIAMDIKAPLARLAELTGVSGQAEVVQQSIGIIAESGIDHLFRTTDVTPLLGQEDHQVIRQLVPPGSPHIVQPFVARYALDPKLRRETAV